MSELPPICIDIDKEFPIRKEWVYLNHAAYSPTPARTAAAVKRFLDDSANNGCGNYGDWKAALANARKLSGQLLGCEANDVGFIKNTNHGLLCVANSINWREGDNVVIFEGEFPANVHPWRNLASLGVETKMVPMRDGWPVLEDMEAAIDSRTRLAAISWVGFVNGFRVDCAEFGAICRRKKILSCVDGIQGLGGLPCDVTDWDIDFFASGGHKWLMCMEGMGVLYCAKRTIEQMNDTMTGWCSREGYSNYDEFAQPVLPDARRFEEGSWCMILAHSCEASIGMHLEVGIENAAKRIRALTDRAAEGLQRDGWIIHVPRNDENWSGIVTASKSGLDPTPVADRLLDRKINIAARSGRIRFAPHYYNTFDDIDQTLEALRDEMK